MAFDNLYKIVTTIDFCLTRAVTFTITNNCIAGHCAIHYVLFSNIQVSDIYGLMNWFTLLPSFKFKNILQTLCTINYYVYGIL